MGVTFPDQNPPTPSLTMGFGLPPGSPQLSPLQLLAHGEAEGSEPGSRRVQVNSGPRAARPSEGGSGESRELNREGEGGR